MDGKVSKKTNKATPGGSQTPTPGGSQTPQRHTRKTPSKTVSKAGSKAAAKTPAKGKSGKQQNRSSQSNDDQSDEQSENESDNQSEGDTGVYDTYEQARRRVYNSDDDFLGRPASRTSEETSESVDEQPSTVERSGRRVRFMGHSTSSEETSGNVDQPPSKSSQASNTGRRPARKQRKPKKRPSQTPVIKEIIKLQNSTNLLIPKLSFQRVVREVLQECKEGFRVQSTSLACLQEAAEHYLTQLFEDAYMCCLHRRRVTLNEKDLLLVSKLRGLV